MLKDLYILIKKFTFCYVSVRDSCFCFLSVVVPFHEAVCFFEMEIQDIKDSNDVLSDSLSIVQILCMGIHL